MHAVSVVAACLCLVAGFASAQYPARGNPDPAFNGGKLRVQPFTDPASGNDRLDVIVPLSSVRFAGLGVRPDDRLDFVAVIDTVPERVTSFDTQFEASSNWEALWTLAPVGTALVLGGVLQRPDGTTVSALQVREIGLRAAPAYDNRGTVISVSTDAQRRNATTTAVTARAGVNGTNRIWQARANFDDKFDCGRTTLYRLDHSGTSLTERGSVDVSTLLSRTCLVAYYAIPHDRLPSDPPNAEAIILGASCRDAAGTVAYFCAVRILDVNGTVSIDPSFGPGGLAIFGAGSGFNYLVRDVRADAASRLVVVLDKAESTGNFAQITGVLLRLTSDGRIDGAFGTSGTLEIPTGGVNHVGGVGIASNGTLQVAGSSTVNGVERPYAFYYDPVTRQQQYSRVDFLPANPAYTSAGFNGVTALAAGGAFAVGWATTGAGGHGLLSRLTGDRQTVDLVEYFHAAFGHYFLASVLAEIVKLDDGTFVGWERTGESFAAYPTGAAGVDDVCRFFSATFAPRSSHFYTPIAAECEGLKTGGVWGYEGLVFALQNTPTGACPAGTRNLHRLYNNGLDGAPNHRYTVSDAIRRSQAGQGWTEEGNGTPPVFACLPT